MKMANSKMNSTKNGSVGILIVGLGGANGTTLLSGVFANRRNLAWRGARGEPMKSNYYGCITQLNQKGVHGGVGYKDKVNGLADATTSAVGGWDIRPGRVGDALLDHQILDYDLVRQVKDDMNEVKVFRGYYDPRFIGSSQHEGATYTLTEKEVPNAAMALKRIRADIRYFKWKNGVVGHTTVIWSASVEPNADLCVPGGRLDTAKGLLEAIELNEKERGGPLPPSLIYATAAILEGCSFVNGGSQNTLCGGLAELAQLQSGVYCLGTDFKAGQTKFKTAAVEYIRTMGLTPKVIASSNHLGNNDMKNLATADKARMAKLRVKHNIFAAWKEDIDHKVAVMYTPMINDEKRDFVEYTSLGFLGQTHTMVTYTRASDSVLCVPLMIDAAVWCDYFSHRGWPYEQTAKALAYLFKVPEGAAKGVDPGFFRQMEELNAQVLAANEVNDAEVRQRTQSEGNVGEWAIPGATSVICAGLACVDMQLNQATGGDGGEAIETFKGETSIGGGSVSMSTKTLSRLCHGAFSEASSPVINSIIPLCKVGNDDTGNKLIALLEKTGAGSHNVHTKYIKNARKRDSDPSTRTALAVLPIYQDGRRGCFFDAASNSTFETDDIVEMIKDLTNDASTPSPGAFLFGYPHLLPKMQGEALAQLFSKARLGMEDDGIIAMDLNGVPETKQPNLRTVEDLKSDKIIGAALANVDILHMNEEELIHLTGCSLEGSESSESKDEVAISEACSLFLKNGVAVIVVTRGSNGCYIACNDKKRFEKSPKLPASWANNVVKSKAMQLPKGTIINANGAGDSFTSGFLTATMLRQSGISSELDQSPSNDDEDLSNLAPKFIPEDRRITAYTLYMREHYLSLKAQCDDDKKAMFEKCNKMWENEPEETKELYETKCKEEIEMSISENVSDLDLNKSTSNMGMISTSKEGGEAMKLESAAQFASLVAAHHIDMSTRENLSLDLGMLLERAMINPDDLAEI